MPKPSAETIKIRRIVDRLSEDELRTTGLGDLKTRVEKAGLDFSVVRDKVNNELARARRRKGVRKGHGRRTVEWPSDEEFQLQIRLLEDLQRFRRKHFESWAEFRQALSDLFALRDRYGSDEHLMSMVEIQFGDELAGQGQ